MNNPNENPQNYVLWWWMRGEFSEQRGDWQATSCFELPGADLLQDASSETALSQTPLGEPRQAFDVRAVFDSRFVGSYDFNFSAEFVTTAAGGAVPAIEFNVPQGYRAIPRKWEVLLTVPTAAGGVFNNISFNYNNAAVPNNQQILFGLGGTEDPIETFFLCEEQTQFGATITLGAATIGGFGVLTCHGNLIPVNSNALPFSIANQTAGGY
jgi:hypothetical protein